MRRISILVATLAFTSLDACESWRWGPKEPEAPEVDPVTIHVEGRVTAADDGSAVAGARVRLSTVTNPIAIRGRPSFGHALATSDTLGRYALSFSFTNEEYCAGSRKWVGASAEGFLCKGGLQRTSSWMDESDVTCQESQTLNIQLERDVSNLDQTDPTN